MFCWLLLLLLMLLLLLYWVSYNDILGCAMSKNIRPQADERGRLRSGARFAKRNPNYFNTVKECLDRHSRLVDEPLTITTRETKIASITSGTLLQTVVRFNLAHDNILGALRSHFFSLFREHGESETEGFEVVTTFNAVLKSQV